MEPLGPTGIAPSLAKQEGIDFPLFMGKYAIHSQGKAAFASQTCFARIRKRKGSSKNEGLDKSNSDNKCNPIPAIVDVSVAPLPLKLWV